jgi:hypothetical protein
MPRQAQAEKIARLALAVGIEGERLGDAALEAAANDDDQGAEVGAGGEGEPVKGDSAEMLADAFGGYIGQNLKNQRVERSSGYEFDGRIYSIAGKAGPCSDPNGIVARSLFHYSTLA